MILEGKSITIANIYSPNRDNPDFFPEIQESVYTADTDFKIISGDFNCVLDSGLDKSGGREEHANKRSQLFIITWIEENDLVDIWRNKHPNTRRYTYH